jgi:AAA domain-containing protein
VNATVAAKPLPQSPKLVIVPASSIKTAPIKWLWPDVIALGMTNLFTGNPDQCKSLMIADLAARASRGARWLDGAENTIGPVDVLMMFNEDPAANVVVPRLIAAEADLERIHILQHVRTAADTEREFSIAADIKLLRRHVEEHPSIRLIAIDPFSGYFGAQKELYKDQTVREVTAPLIQLAEETGVAILNNSHLNKTRELSAIQKVIGAMAVAAIHRMAWAFASSDNEQDRTERLVLPLKHNITANADGIKFSVNAVPVTLDDGTPSQQPRIVYKGKTELTAEETIGMTTEQKTQLQQVLDILLEELADHVQKDCGPITQRIRAEAQDCSDSLITKARKKAGVKTIKVGKRWQWVLPGPRQEAGCPPFPAPECRVSCMPCAP